MARPQPSDVRLWVREQGRPVGDRGRLAPGLVADYLAASGPRGTAPAPSTPPAAAIKQAARPAAAVGGPDAGVRIVRAKEHWDWQRRGLARDDG